jgi:indolepyruvate ferredoxin oxidoreductase beta subunit
MKTVNILVVGVGGQGIVAASDIIADMALSKGHDVKKSEIHGMSQRGGVVSSYVRFGDSVASPIPFDGSIDFILSFEEMEALRWAGHMSHDTKVIINTHRIKPVTLALTKQEYPDVKGNLKHDKTFYLDATTEAKKIGSEKVVNSLMVGALCAFTEFSEEDFKASLTKRVKKFIDENIAAFKKGKEMVENYVL